MPRYVRKRRTRRRRTYRRRRRKKTSSVSIRKLRDKRINTIFEVRAKQIAKKEAMKLNKPNWICVRGDWHDPQQPGFDALADVWPPLLSYMHTDETQFHVHELAKCGGYLNNEVSDPLAAAGVDRRSMFITMKEIKFNFQFVNEGVKAVVVDFQLTRMPYSKMALFLEQNAPTPAQNPQPVYQDHRPFCSINTISRECLKAYKQSDSTQGNLNRRVQVLARKRIVIPPPRMIDDPAGGGGNRVNTVRFHALKLNKFWKGLGKRERYQIINGVAGPFAGQIRGSLADARYFWSLRVTGPCRYLGVSHVKFAASHLLDRQLVFDIGAPLAQ